MNSPFQRLGVLATTDDDTLLMSRLNCHGIGISSIVLKKNDDGSLVRMFLAWPNHELWRNGLAGHVAFSVGPHDHMYDLRIEPLAGYVENLIFERGFGCPVDEYIYRSPMLKSNKGSDHLQFESKTSISLAHSCVLQSETFMSRSVIHTMAVPCEQPAAWLVREGLQVKDHTHLFTNDHKPRLEGLYVPFRTADCVRSHIEEFMRLFN